MDLPVTVRRLRRPLGVRSGEMSSESVSGTMLMAAPRDHVFACITAWCSTTSGETRRCKILEGGNGRPSVVLYEMAGLGLSIEYVLRYRVLEPEWVRFDLVRSRLLYRLDGGYELEDVGGGTRCTYLVTAVPRLRLPGIVIRRIGRLVIRQGLHDLKREAEGTL